MSTRLTPGCKPDSDRDDEKKTLAKVRTLHGKVFHTWVAGTVYPEGPAKLFWAVTGKAPFVVAPGNTKTPPELKRAGGIGPAVRCDP